MRTEKRSRVDYKTIGLMVRLYRKRSIHFGANVIHAALPPRKSVITITKLRPSARKGCRGTLRCTPAGILMYIYVVIYIYLYIFL